MSVQFENCKTTEMIYLLGLLYIQSFTLDINTTVSTCNELMSLMSYMYFTKY